jgi:hypothetical protein
MASAQDPSINAFNKLVDDLIRRADGHPDGQILQTLKRDERENVHYLGMGQEVVIDGLGYLVIVSGSTSQARGSDYLQHNLHVEAFGPEEESERRGGEAVRYTHGFFSVFSGIREGRVGLYEQPCLEHEPREALVAPFGNWAVRSVMAHNDRRNRGDNHPDPHDRMSPESYPTAKDLDDIRAFSSSAEHVYAREVPADTWLSSSILLRPPESGLVAE